MHQFSAILKAMQLHNKFYRSTFVPPSISVTPTNAKYLVTQGVCSPGGFVTLPGDFIDAQLHSLSDS